MLESQDTYTKQQYNEPEKMDKEQLRGVKNRSAALGRLAMKLLGGGGGLQLVCGRPTLALSSAFVPQTLSSVCVEDS